MDTPGKHHLRKGRSGYTFYTRENQNNFKKIIKEEK